MDRNKLLPAILLISILAVDVSSPVKLRVLMAEGKENVKPRSYKVSPSPTPVPENLAPSNGPESSSSQGPKGEDHQGSNSLTGSGGSPDSSQGEEKCDALPKPCHDAKKLDACLQHSGNAANELFLLVQNAGENALTVKITAPSSLNIDVKILHLSGHNAKKIKVSANATDGGEIVLNAGNGDCILHMSPSASYWDLLQQLPAYATRMTPIYGVYFLFLTMVIAGGTWACCKSRRKGRRAGGGVPYQQLEMGIQPQSNSVDDVHVEDGWDQGWNDDWDDEEAVTRPSEIRPNGNVSSNGLTSRSPNKDGWDN